MSGVTTGTRLEQLLALRARIDHEIEQERAKAEPPRRREKPVTLSVPKGADQDALRMHGVCAAEVRRWAKHRGHPIGDRGRVPTWLIQQYVEETQ